MKKVLLYLNKYYLYIIIFISFLGTAGSLFMSEFLTLTPCDLCWYRRIFMYAIFAVALIGAVIKDEADTYKYILGLAIPGLLIALYNYYIQLFPQVQLIECSLENPCSRIDFQLFGFLTIPLMSAIAFITTLLICLAKIKLKKL